MESFDQIDEIIAEAKENMLPAAKKFAQEYQKDTMFYVLACGALQGTGYTMVSAICWRCSVCMPRISTAENISMDRLKQRIGMCR